MRFYEDEPMSEEISSKRGDPYTKNNNSKNKVKQVERTKAWTIRTKHLVIQESEYLRSH